MGWFWRKDSDGGSDPNDSERPDGAQGPIDPWGYEPSASGGGVRTVCCAVSTGACSLYLSGISSLKTKQNGFTGYSAQWHLLAWRF